MQEKAKFQGIGSREYFRYGMHLLTENQLGDLAGNSFFACKALMQVGITAFFDLC